ncbi:hypothetical protein ALC53_12255, partial [Atta colombica]
REETTPRYSLAILRDKGNLQMVVSGIEDTQPQILSRRGMTVIVLGLVAYLEWFGLHGLALSRRQCYRSYSYLALRRYYPRPFLFGRASGHYAATIASLSTVCNVTCLRGLAEASQMVSRDNIVRRIYCSPFAFLTSFFPHTSSYPVVRSSRAETAHNIAIFSCSFMDSLGASLRNETINESLLMNKIVGRVADRSACNRKENRIKRALNGAIIHENGDEGFREGKKCASADSQIDERRVWRKNEGVSAEACAEKETAINRKVDGICATQSGHVVKTMTKHVDLNNRSTFAAGPTTKPIGKFCT